MQWAWVWKWIWRGKGHSDEVDLPAAQAASHQAQCNLDESRERWGAVSRAEENIKRLRRENHFADTIRWALREGL